MKDNPESASKKAETVGCVKVLKDNGSEHCEYVAAGKVLNNNIDEGANESEMPFCQGKSGNSCS